MNDKELAVYERYKKGASEKEESLCCPTTYNPDLLKIIPPEILEKDYGCGDPSLYINEGETALDLGSGGGKLCYIIAQVVGPKGKVIGVDMNPEMLALARKYKKEISDKLGYSNVEFKKGKIQNLKLDLEKLDDYLKANSIQSSEDLIRLEAHIRYLENTYPLIRDNSIDVVVSNCVLNLVKPEDKAMLFSEIYRVLKVGGRAVISDIVSDEDIPESLQNDPELWSGCISGAFREDLFLKAFEDAGFGGIEILNWGSTPWKIIDGIEFRSVTVRAYKLQRGSCIDYGDAVIYKGKFKQAIDEEGHIFERGKRVAVCRRTFDNLKKEPYKGDFIFLESENTSQIRPFPCDGKIYYRDPKETKGLVAFSTIESTCCPSGQCSSYEPFTTRLMSINKLLTKEDINVIQVNVGSLCNQACNHCHVNASPDNKDIMSWDVMEDIIGLLKNNPGLNLDITGGAPELHPMIEKFLLKSRPYTKNLTFRSNLTALIFKKELIKILSELKVELICSLPDILEEKTDQQRGKGVYAQSIKVLKMLNDLGYGYETPLHLVHNPTDFTLAELHDAIEKKYKSHLWEEYGIVFNKLFILNNMPIGRFKKSLENQNNYRKYIEALCSNFNSSTLDGLMCRHLLNIGWDGKVYDCDFNNAIDLPMEKVTSISDIKLEDLIGMPIVVGDHCYGCTAIKGSGCFGSIVK